MPSFCSPENEHIYEKSKTCYNLKELQLIAKNYNKAMPTNPIPIHVKKTVLLDHLKSRLPMHESKWVDLDFMKVIKKETRDELKEIFRPSTPSSWTNNNREWLTTYDILNVMNQYEKKYKSFKFLGVHPIDFAFKPQGYDTCISNELCRFDIKTFLKGGYSQFAVIFNLDKHYEPGSHWVAFYCGLKPTLKNFGCYFIDSNSTETPKEVVKLMKNIKLQIDSYYKKNIANKFKSMENRKRFQFKNSECGMFSMYFIIQFLKQIPFSEIIETNIDDDDVHKFRYVFYNSKKTVR